MFYKKDGLPEEHEIVMCTVTKIQYHSVFVNIDEYGIQGMIHISEISAGRIRNIRDYVKEGKVIVCKVLRVNTSKGHIDLSLRRVNDAQRRAKVNQIKQEKKAESIIEFIARKHNLEVKELYNKLASNIFEHYTFLHEAFEDVVEGNTTLKELSIEEELADKLTFEIRQRMKPKEVKISGNLELKTYASNGVQIVKDALKYAQAVEGMSVTYLGGGRYRLVLIEKDYKVAEPKLRKAVSRIVKYMEEHDGESHFTREDK